MKYFFNLGSNKALSISEVQSVFPEAKNGIIYNGNLFVFEMEKEFDAKKIIARMGGIIKIGQVIKEGLPLYGKEMENVIEKMLEPKEGKFKYGISNYAKFASPVKDKVLALKVKKYLKEKEVSCRWVVGKERVLSSVIVEQNLLKGNGIEIVIAGNYKESFVGKTLAVQDFKDLSYRDYGRPSRDDHSGMLPPKLAQIMLNLSRASFDDMVMDPFCGSGTMVSEAMIMGYKNIIGSDLSQKAVDDTRENTDWIKRKYEIKDVETEIFCSDARQLDKKIKAGSIGAIVTEPYLGPQRGEINQMKVQDELNKLYTEAIRTFEKLLKKGGRLVMVWPVRVVGDKKIFLSPDLSGLRKVGVIEDNFTKEFKNNFSHRGTILYGRDGQRVWREIVVLIKN